MVITNPRKKDNGISKVIKSGNLKVTILYTKFGFITPSAACSKYPTNLDPTTKKKNIIRIPTVDLKTSAFKLLKKNIFFIYAL